MNAQVRPWPSVDGGRHEHVDGRRERRAPLEKGLDLRARGTLFWTDGAAAVPYGETAAETKVPKCLEGGGM